MLAWRRYRVALIRFLVALELVPLLSEEGALFPALILGCLEFVP